MVALIVDVFTSEHLVIGSNIMLAVVTYRLIPMEQRHQLRKAARQAARLGQSAKTAGRHRRA